MEKIESSSLSWIMQALLCSFGKEKTATLKDIIMKGDVINHAIFNCGELQNGLFILLEFGIIETVNEKFKLTEKGNNLFENAIGNRFSISKQYSIIDRVIRNTKMPNIGAKMCYNEKLNPIVFRKREFDEMISEYLKEANSVVDEIIMRNK